MEKRKRSCLPYVLCLALGLGLALLVAVGRGFGGAGQTPALQARWLSDGFFVAAVLQTGAGGLVAISTATDFFDIISYGFRSLLVLFTPFRKPQDQKKFYEFKLERQAKRGGAKWFLLLSGLTLLGLSLLCLGLYYWL